MNAFAMTRDRSHLVVNLAQTFVWVCVFLFPAGVDWAVSGNVSHAFTILKASFHIVLPVFLIYIVNYLFLVPRCFFGKERKWFFISNAVLLILLNLRAMMPGPLPEEVKDNVPVAESEMWAMYAVIVVTKLFVQCLFILLAVGLRQIIRNGEMQMKLQEERRKRAEAELTWLKNQLNPHFLFNTLNNISSLTQIDPDRAQESIGQLSELLRYALYDSNRERVPLSGEVAFMKNYIGLMQLRCNEMTAVEQSFEVPDAQVEIAPLLFISLIENAFKHGVNARRPSFVRVDMKAAGEDLVFVCENSFFGKAGEEAIGSGIGLENMKRRLELIYPGAYRYEQAARGEIYRASVILQNIVPWKHSDALS